jgi:hypothetical protein
MSLPAAMNALKRGEIVAPTGDDGLGGMMMVDAELPQAPAPAERDWSDLDRATAEVRAQSAVDRAEMAHRIAAKKGISIEAAQAWMEENSRVG